MLRFLTACILTTGIFVLTGQQTLACGYSFIGDCSSKIHLQINGTIDSFNVAPCPSTKQFNGLQLGGIQSLLLTRAKTITWESCQNNVTGATLYYRIYPQGAPGGSWQTLGIGEESNSISGPYTTRIFATNTGLNLTSGLTIGQQYVLEVFFRAAVDTIGNDFIPETYMNQHNNGLNYQLSFQYLGNSAPPFTAVTTLLQQPVCGSSNGGIIGVSIYGNQQGLFYSWSNVALNFPVQYNLTPGSYTLTVTGVNGYSQAITNQILPASGVTLAISAEICAGASYVRGSHTFNTTGNYTFTLPAPGGCDTLVQLSLVVLSPSSLLPELPAEITLTCTQPSAEFCAASYPNTQFIWQKSGGNTVIDTCFTFSGIGVYTVTALLTGNQIGCSAGKLVVVTADQSQPPAAVLPPLRTSNCLPTGAAEMIVLRADPTLAGLEYRWIHEGVLVGEADSCLIPLSWLLQGQQVYLETMNANGCISQPAGIPAMGLAPPLAIQFTTVNASSVSAADGIAIVSVSGGVPAYQYSWNNGSALPAQSSLTPGNWCVTVTDVNNCMIQGCTQISAPSGVGAAQGLAAGVVFPTLLHVGQEISLTGFTEPVTLQLFNSSGVLYSNLKRFNVENSERLPTKSLLPGVYILWIISPSGYRTLPIVVVP